jgi:hypothetical protein
MLASLFFHHGTPAWAKIVGWAGIRPSRLQNPCGLVDIIQAGGPTVFVEEPADGSE